MRDICLFCLLTVMRPAVASTKMLSQNLSIFMRHFTWWLSLARHVSYGKKAAILLEPEGMEPTFLVSECL